ncbi:hypothetical protein [Hymenobacter sp. BRD67]|uniref:hypothetical protein n=1 Tax=Hymenobacter sp. BRD67 TaxID=2675877 RepID=UPI0015633865|nr:hypothetical protein [Hymenobacter sp. BRD67]QKG54525.1 hypothetical protein GKZ67_20425 [Hymenobacter sp. BRD67]
MGQRYFLLTTILGSSLLLATAARSQAQQPAADSVLHPPKLLLKAGLRLTHLRYTHDSQSWQLLLPLSLGAEYRVAPRASFYTHFEADMLTTYTAARRRGGQRGGLPAASVAVGVRYYYGHAHQAAPVFGRYLALEGSADWEQLAAPGVVVMGGGRRRSTPAALTPGVYVLWGCSTACTRTCCMTSMPGPACWLRPTTILSALAAPATGTWAAR